MFTRRSLPTLRRLWEATFSGRRTEAIRRARCSTTARPAGCGIEPLERRVLLSAAAAGVADMEVLSSTMPDSWPVATPGGSIYVYDQFWVINNGPAAVVAGDYAVDLYLNSTLIGSQATQITLASGETGSVPFSITATVPTNMQLGLLGLSVELRPTGAYTDPDLRNNSVSFLDGLMVEVEPTDLGMVNGTASATNSISPNANDWSDDFVFSVPAIGYYSVSTDAWLNINGEGSSFTMKALPGTNNVTASVYGWFDGWTDYTLTVAKDPAASLFSSIGYYGDAMNYTELNPGNWNVWYDGADIRYFIPNTNYQNLSGSRLGEYTLIKGRSCGDFSITLDARSAEDLSVNGSADYALVFGYVDANNYNYMMMSSSQANSKLCKVVNGSVVSLATAPAASKAGVPDNNYHTTTLRRVGQTVSVLLDGVQILSSTDAGYAAVGQIGFGSFNDAAYFDNVTVNRAPTSLAISAASIAENKAGGTVVGVLSSTDPDAGDSVAYSLVGGDTTSFAISGGQLKTSASFNYEVKKSYSLIIRSTDPGGLFVDKTFTIAVADVNEAPSVGTFSRSLVQNSSLAFAAADFASAFADPDTGSTPHALHEIQIVTLPGHGGLKLNGVAVAAGAKIAAGQIGTLSYAPTIGYSGSDGFTWKGSDGLLYSSAGAAVNLTISAAGETKLRGTVIGTGGSYLNKGNTIAKVFDGNTSTYFDGPAASGNWVGLDLSTAQRISKVRYYPRATFGNRMVGGKFQGSNTADFSSGVVDLFTITTVPIGWTDVAISNTGTFRYVRYLAPANSYGNISELEFYTPATAQPDLKWASLSSASYNNGLIPLPVYRSYQITDAPVGTDFIIQYRLSVNQIWGDSDDRVWWAMRRLPQWPTRPSAPTASRSIPMPTSSTMAPTGCWPRSTAATP